MSEFNSISPDLTANPETADPNPTTANEPENQPEASPKPPWAEAFSSNVPLLTEGESFNVQLPDPDDDQIAEEVFGQMVEQAWQVCDRFDLQTDIWRGRILRTVRDREKKRGGTRGAGFLAWLQEREITKSQAYKWIELADSADMLLENGQLLPEDLKQFSKRAFVETAQAAPEVQQLVAEAAKDGEPITRREVRHLADQWSAMSSDILPESIKERVAAHTLPTRYVAPLVREIEKLPDGYQSALRQAIIEDANIDNIKQVTSDAQRLGRYLQNTGHIQALQQHSVDLETALQESLRLGCLKPTSELVTAAAQLEQMVAKLYSTWRRVNTLADQLYGETGESTPHLRDLLDALGGLSHSVLEVQLGSEERSYPIRLQILQGDPAGNLPQ